MSSAHGAGGVPAGKAPPAAKLTKEEKEDLERCAPAAHFPQAPVAICSCCGPLQPVLKCETPEAVGVLGMADRLD